MSGMSKAVLEQIRYWTTALQQSQKGHRRKNKYINRLLREVSSLSEQERIASLTAAELIAKNERLRTALELIANNEPCTINFYIGLDEFIDDTREFAREALKGE